jgi:hypothetical protein
LRIAEQELHFNRMPTFLKRFDAGQSKAASLPGVLDDARVGHVVTKNPVQV